MSNEKTTTKKKRGRPKKVADGGTKKTKKYQKKTPSEKTASRKSRLKADERASIKRKIVAHFGATKIETALENVKLKKDIDAVLLQFKKELEYEIEQQERDISEYYETIDAEYKAVGRPKSVLNWKEFEYLCSIGCTLEEIAGFFQVAKSTLQDRVEKEFGENFTARYEKLSQGMKVALRRKQFHVAMDGDTAMLKFLGKNVLGQKDKLDFDGEVKVNSWVDLVNNLEPENNNEDRPGKCTHNDASNVSNS